MDSRAEIREFLMSRRAKVTPEQAGVPTYGGLRRVPGLRRDEVAQLAGVSTDYYTRLERGTTTGVSDAVLEAVAAALLLDEAEREHLMDQTRTARSSGRHPSRTRVRPGVQRLLDGMTGIPAFVQNGRLDMLAVNILAGALYAELLDTTPVGVNRGGLPNHARFTFLDPRAADFYPDWNLAAATAVAMLRTETGRRPQDRVLNEMVGELTTRSDRFAALWAGHDVRLHTTGTKRFHHRVAGDMSLQYETLDLAADPGQTLITYTAEVGSPSQDALNFLASWATAPPPVPIEQGAVTTKNTPT